MLACGKVLQAWMEEHGAGRQPRRAQNLRLPKRGLLLPSDIKDRQWTQESPTAGPTFTLMGGGSPGPT